MLRVNPCSSVELVLPEIPTCHVITILHNSIFSDFDMMTPSKEIIRIGDTVVLVSRPGIKMLEILSVVCLRPCRPINISRVTYPAEVRASCPAKETVGLTVRDCSVRISITSSHRVCVCVCVSRRKLRRGNWISTLSGWSNRPQVVLNYGC